MRYLFGYIRHKILANRMFSSAVDLNYFLFFPDGFFFIFCQSMTFRPVSCALSLETVSKHQQWILVENCLRWVHFLIFFVLLCQITTVVNRKTREYLITEFVNFGFYLSLLLWFIETGNFHGIHLYLALSKRDKMSKVSWRISGCL